MVGEEKQFLTTCFLRQGQVRQAFLILADCAILQIFRSKTALFCINGPGVQVIYSTVKLTDGDILIFQIFAVGEILIIFAVKWLYRVKT